MQRTLDYYNQNARDFVTDTRTVEFAHMQNRFLDKLPAGAKILDFGCGSGRDTKYFLDQGYEVKAVDGSKELCKIASEYTGITVQHMLFQELDAKEAYDGIWACASILHVPYGELKDIFVKMHQSLKAAGVIYTSFKYGTYEGDRGGRYYTDMTEETLAKLLKDVPGLVVEESWVTGDVRPGRGDEKWLNVMLRRK